MERATPQDRDGGPFRLLWVIDSLTAGGAESLVVAFARSVDPAKVDFRVVCLKSIGGNPFETALRQAGVRCENLGARNLRDAAALRRLVTNVRDFRPHVVHAHLAYASIWGPVAARIAGRPAVATLHLPPSTASASTREGIRERLRCRTIRWGCDAAIAVSRYVASAHLESGRIPADRLVVAHNGVDTRAFRPAAGPDDPRRIAGRDALAIDPDAPLAIAVSVLRPGKGIETLVDAAARVPRARFAIVGDGPLAPAIADRVRELGLEDRIVLAGFRADPANLLAAADLFVLPSQIDDALPTVLLEAAAAGLPAVATRVGGVPEIVADGRTGLLVDPGDAAGLARAVETLLADRATRDRMSRAARERAEAEFSLPAWRDRLEAIYSSVAGGVA